jgi:hypothetical protein
MWRIGGDLWDNWAQVKGTIPNRAIFHSHSFNWPDNDMLPFGPLVGTGKGGNGNPNIQTLRPSDLTIVEAKTLMTFWSVSQSPLMFGGYLPDVSPDELALLTNREVLHVNEHGVDARQVRETPTSRFCAFCFIGRGREGQGKVWVCGCVVARACLGKGTGVCACLRLQGLSRGV